MCFSPCSPGTSAIGRLEGSSVSPTPSTSNTGPLIVKQENEIPNAIDTVKDNSRKKPNLTLSMPTSIPCTKSKPKQEKKSQPENQNIDEKSQTPLQAVPKEDSLQQNNLDEKPHLNHILNPLANAPSVDQPLVLQLTGATGQKDLKNDSTVKKGDAVKMSLKHIDADENLPTNHLQSTQQFPIVQRKFRQFPKEFLKHDNKKEQHQVTPHVANDIKLPGTSDGAETENIAAAAMCSEKTFLRDSRDNQQMQPQCEKENVKVNELTVDHDKSSIS